jgi:putative oxidoreductase
MKLLARLTSSSGPRAVLLIRLMVGAVFLSEGIQKFLFSAEVGAGRFAKIGLPWPEFLGPFVGGFEIVCGALVLAGLLTRLAVIPLLTIMAVALYSTKLPILLKSGFWKMAHEARTDFSMTLGALFLLIAGAGVWSLDAWLNRRGAQHARGSSSSS